MGKKRSTAGGPEPEISHITVPSAWAETLWARGELTLTKRQISQLGTQAQIIIKPDQAPSAWLKSEGRSKTRVIPIEWWSPIEAVHWLAPHVGGDDNAKRAIGQRLVDGGIESTFVWSCSDVDAGPLPTRRLLDKNFTVPATVLYITPPVRNSNSNRLGLGFFLESDNWESDMKRWDWTSGTIVVSKKRGVILEHVSETGEKKKLYAPLRSVAFGVRYNREDIERIVRPTALSNPIPADVASNKKPKRGTVGPRPKKYNKAPILARIENEIVTGAIHRLGKVTDYGIQTKIEDEIIDALTHPNGEPPSRSTVRRWVKPLMKVWRAENQFTRS